MIMEFAIKDAAQGIRMELLNETEYERVVEAGLNNVLRVN